MTLTKNSRSSGTTNILSTSTTRQPPSSSVNKQSSSIARPPQQNSRQVSRLLDASSTARIAFSRTSCTLAPTTRPPLVLSTAELLDTSTPGQREVSAIVAAQLHQRVYSPMAAGVAAPVTPCNLAVALGASTSTMILWPYPCRRSSHLVSVRSDATPTHGYALSGTEPTPTLPTPMHSAPPCARLRASSIVGLRATNAGVVTHSLLPW